MMFIFKTCSRRRGWAAAAALFLIVPLLLCACSKKKNPVDSSAPATAEVTVPTILPPDTQDSSIPAPSTEAPVETESIPPETALNPDDWNPSLNRDDISFFGPGESFTLVADGIPAGAEILWTAENEAIAAIDETGRVTAVGPGSARVYAEVAGHKLTCWIRCVFDPVAENDPTLNKTDISFFGPGENFVLSVQNAPENAGIRWTSEDYDVATVDEAGHVYAVGPGTVKVKAQVNGHVLSCWVRCQFAAPEKPRSNVADGKWLFSFRKDQVTEPDENGVYTAAATLLRPIQISEDRVFDLVDGGNLDLSDYGYELYFVDSVKFTDDKTQCTMKAGDTELVFERTDHLQVTENTGAWTLIEPNNGVPICYNGGTYRLVFDENTACLDEMSAVLEGTTGTIRRSSLLEFFGRNGYEDEIYRVGISVRNGLVTEAKWYYQP